MNAKGGPMNLRTAVNPQRRAHDATLRAAPAWPEGLRQMAKPRITVDVKVDVAAIIRAIAQLVAVVIFLI